MANNTQTTQRNLFAFDMMTLNGFYEGPNHEFDWPNVDEEFNAFSIEQLDTIRTLFFGRITYEGMASYWPTASDDDPAVAEKMNSIPKVVFSTTLESADWNNTRLVSENIVEEVEDLKRQSGGDIAIFGSSKLTVSMLEAGLVDEIRVIVNPVLLVDGNTLFAGLSDTLELTHTATRTFDSGNVLVTYEPIYG